MNSPRLALTCRPAAALLLALLAGLAAPAAPAQAQTPDAPRLVVFLSIDQMRGDYITRYGPRWTGGLKRLVDDGALWVQSAYPYFNTVTCAGHATMGTGTFPSTHGMVLNGWYDRETGKTVSCTDDASVSLVSYGAGAPKADAVAHSARLLRASTFADELRGQAARTPRVVSFSMKPRSAINLAGRAGDVVLWYGGADAGWSSSTAFAPGKLPFVERFVAQHPVEKEFATPWTKILPDAAYLYDDDGVGEQPAAGWTRTFPHPLTVTDATAKGSAAARWAASPFPDAYLGRFAIAAIDEFKFGQTPGIDYLAVSFSQLDGSGHAFGPRSHEVQDTLARLDKVIGDLLAALDAKVGAGRYVVALTGDHGVSPIPEQMKAMGFDAGRVDLKAVSSAVEQALATKFGPGKYVAHVAYTDLYFERGVVEKLKADPSAMQLVIDTIERIDGIQRVVPSHTLPEVHATDDRLVQAARYSYAPDRSGDLFLMPKPYWLMSSAGTTHGTGYQYDERVPVLLFGAGVRPGKYWNAATPADLAPTLAALCGITMARPDGRVLAEGLAAPTQPPHATARQATP